MNTAVIETCDAKEFNQLFLEAAAQHVPEAEMPLFSRFSSLFFHRYALEDLMSRSWADVVGQAYYLWQLVQNPAGLPLVQVFQPSLKTHGWTSPYTVLAISQVDMPFLVDSIRIELNRRNITVHGIKSTPFHCKRESEKITTLTQVTEKTTKVEAVIYIEMDLRCSKDGADELVGSLKEVLQLIEKVVESYAPMKTQVTLAMEQLQTSHFTGVAQTQAFLAWLMGNNFTFLGFSEFAFESRKNTRVLVENTEKRLGLFDDNSDQKTTPLNGQYTAVDDFHDSTNVIDFSKSPLRSRVHRNAYLDFVVIKRFDDKGNACGEFRFLGLYTSSAYTMSPSEIPLLQDKIRAVYERIGINSWSHEGKALQQIVETFPRDELFQSSEYELFQTLTGVLSINERHQVRLFMRHDHFKRFISCLIYIPRDLLTTKLRRKIQNFLADEIHAVDQEFTVFFSESALARVHLVCRLGRSSTGVVDVESLQESINAMAQSWEERLFNATNFEPDCNNAVSSLNAFDGIFSQAYQEYYQPEDALLDMVTIKDLSTSDIAMQLQHHADTKDNFLQFKIFHTSSPLELSSVIPVLENMGLRVISEHPFEIKQENNSIWLHDFKLLPQASEKIDIEVIGGQFKAAFIAVWQGRANSDVFNKLVVSATLSWREVEMLRSYANYMHQILFNFSRDFIAQTLVNQAIITRQLVAYFSKKFEPSDLTENARNHELADIKNAVIAALDSVENLSEDRILRYYLSLIDGTLRCNYYQKTLEGENKPYISFKFSPRDIEGIPEPRPLFEIYVSSPRFEGVHLRGGKVARGGLRWSDRLQDYRTEVLGLVKAQQVKNAVIVPNGAKGGFVCKRATGMNRDEFQAEGIACYQDFIRGLIDLTDNLVDGDIVPPKQIVRYDEDDPYLVVAADKGTATFSDIANAISEDYGHWLGDAFASGGSQGYDHKLMGITARGAWVSVQRHFKECGVDIQSTPFTVVGIGDMSGDVFGNGMLLSEKIELTAAFNHLHIFIDPTPSCAQSFKERSRMFALPRSNWGDYNETLISAGGGIFSRKLKSITITPEMKKCFSIEENALTPNQLINRLLKAPVDLIWNGGIGTYVKSTDEIHADVGDKANDVLRVNGADLRCKVFGEGGNLGITQKARIEYALHGGACNSDFIDNAAGVDCSDHEVNIKILLAEQVKSGALTEDARNELLREMTEAVARRVLTNNYKQTQAISIVQSEALSRVTEHQRFITTLESTGRLDRALEFLPTDEQLLERKASGLGLTRPELAILISYAKVSLKEDLAVEDISQDSYIATLVERGFPAEVMLRYPEALYNHRLRTEIIATQLANNIVNTMGCTFVHRLEEAAGVSAATVARAYVAARDVQAFDEHCSAVEALDFVIPASLQITLLKDLMRSVRRTTRWFLRNHREDFHVGNTVVGFKDNLSAIQKSLPTILCGEALVRWNSEVACFVEQGIEPALAQHIVSPGYLYSGLSVVEVAVSNGRPVLEIAPLYFYLIDYLGLDNFSRQISEAVVGNHWQAMAREAYMDDLDLQVRTLVGSLTVLMSEGQAVADVVEKWASQHELLITRWNTMVAQLQLSSGSDFAMFSVALRELLDLVQVSGR